MLTFESLLEKNDKIHKDFNKAIFSYDFGNHTFTFMDYVKHKWQNNEIPHETDSLHIYYLKTKDLKVKVNRNDWREVRKFEVNYTTDKNYYLKYFEPNNYRAIENYVTHEVSFTDLDLSIQKFNYQEMDGWIQLKKEEIEAPMAKGLNILISANHKELNENDFKVHQQYIGLKK